MALPVFAPAYQPSANGTTRATKPRVRTTPFGDGYVHRVVDGQNSMLPTVNVTWDALRLRDAQYILDFFRDQNGAAPFLWTFPGDLAQSVWTATDWNEGWNGSLKRISATFVGTPVVGGI